MFDILCPCNMRPFRNIQVILALSIVCLFIVSGVSAGHLLAPGSNPGGRTSLALSHIFDKASPHLSESNITVGMSPYGDAYDSGKGEIFVANQGSDDLSVISDSTNSVVGTVPTTVMPNTLTFDTGKGQVWITLPNSDLIGLASDTNNTMWRTVTSWGLSPVGIGYDSGKGEIFVANQDSSNVTVISDTTDKVITGITAGENPCAVAYDSGKGEVFVPNAGPSSFDVSIIDDSTNTVPYTVHVGSGPSGAAYDSGKGEVFIANQGSNNVSVISDTTDKVVASIPVGTNPIGVDYDSAMGYVFVSNHGSSNISVISDSTNKVVANYPVGTTPPELAFDSGNGDVYVVNYGVSTVSVISGLSPKVSSFGASPDPITSDHTTFLNVTASGGIPPLKYTYTGLPAGCTSSNVISLTCIPTAVGTFTVRVFANDSTGHFASSSTSLTVYAPLALSSFIAYPSPVTLGQMTYLNVTATGGDLPLTYTYTGLPAGCSSSDVFSLTCIPTSARTSTIRVFVNDSAGHSLTATISLTVYPMLVISTFIASPSTIPIGHQTSLNVTTTGGVPPLTYAYAGLPAGCSTADVFSLTCTPTAFGAYTVRVFVNDTASHSVTSTASLTIYAPVAISSFAASPGAVAIGHMTHLNVTATGGDLPITYTYTGLPAGCSTSSVVSLQCTPTVAGNFEIRVFVNDSAGHSDSATTALIVYAPVAVSSFAASPNAIIVYHSTYLNVTTTGGDPPITYNYTGLPSGCSTSNVVSLACTPTAAGTFVVRVFANDSAGHSASSTASLEVYSPLAISAFTASPSFVSVDQFTYLNVTAAGGVVPLTYAYAGLPAGCSTLSVDSLACVPTATGTFVIRVYANDSAGHSTSATSPLTVNPGSSLLSSVAVTPTTPTVSSGGTQEFTATITCSVTCPTSGETYVWALSSTALGTLSGTGTNVIFNAKSIAGTLGIFVNVTLNGSAKGTSTIITVTTAAVVLNSVTVSPTGIELSSGSTQTFTAVATCSVTTCPSGITYVWTLTSTNMGSFTGTGASLNFTAGSTAGTVGLFVNVTLNGKTLQSLPVIITITSSSGGTSGYASWMWLLILLVIIVALVVIVMVLLMRRRSDERRKKAEASRSAGSSSSANPQLIPPKAPRGYMEGLKVAPAEWDEGAEATAYGTYRITDEDRNKFVEEVNFPGKTGTTSPTKGQPPKAKVDLDATRPWSLKITPEGIAVEGVEATDASGAKVVDAEFVKVEDRKEKETPTTTGEHAYLILQSIASKPRSLDGIKQSVRIDDVELFTLLAALTQAKLIAQATNDTGVSVFGLTTLGRKLGRRFLEAESKKTPAEIPEKGTSTDSTPLSLPSPPSKNGPGTSTARPVSDRSAFASRFFVRKTSPTTTPMTKAPEAKPTVVPATKPLVVDSPTGDKVILDENGKVMMVGHPGRTATATPSPTAPAPPPPLSRGTHVQFEGTIGPERKEEKPFDDEIKAEDVNPNVQHLDPKLLQPLEMRVTQDRGSDVREDETKKDSDARAKELMDRAEKSKKKRKSNYGAEQAPKPQKEDDQ